MASGCATTPGRLLWSIDKPTPTVEKAAVYLFRVSDSRPRPGRVIISVDGKELVGLKDREFSWCYLPPGDHTFRAEWSLMDKPLFEAGHFDAKTLVTKIEANRTYYICYFVQEDGDPPTMLEGAGLLGKALSKSHVVSVELITEDETRALANLASCHFQESTFSK